MLSANKIKLNKYFLTQIVLILHKLRTLKHYSLNIFIGFMIQFKREMGPIYMNQKYIKYSSIPSHSIKYLYIIANYILLDTESEDFDILIIHIEVTSCYLSYKRFFGVIYNSSQIIIIRTTYCEWTTIETFRLFLNPTKILFGRQFLLTSMTSY